MAQGTTSTRFLFDKTERPFSASTGVVCWKTKRNRSSNNHKLHNCFYGTYDVQVLCWNRQLRNFSVFQNQSVHSILCWTVLNTPWLVELAELELWRTGVGYMHFFFCRGYWIWFKNAETWKTCFDWNLSQDVRGWNRMFELFRMDCCQQGRKCEPTKPDSSNSWCSVADAVLLWKLAVNNKNNSWWSALRETHYDHL